jgi:seryl-tRNA synthetase
MATAESDASSRQQQEMLAGAGDLLGALLGGRRRSNPLGQVASRRSATQRARAKVDAEAERLGDKLQELEDLEDELTDEVNQIVAGHQAMAETVEGVEIPLEKTDIRVVDLKLVWVPVS